MYANSTLRDIRSFGAFSQYKFPRAFERYVELGELIGVKGKDDEETFKNWIQAAKDLKKAVDIPDTVWDWLNENKNPEKDPEHGKTPEEWEKEFLDVVDQMSEWAFNDSCTGANPVYPMISELKACYLKAFYGDEKYKAKYGDAISVPVNNPTLTCAPYPLGSVEKLGKEVLGGFN